MTLVEFLLARITEDEQWAARSSIEWGNPYAEEAVRFDHARVLAECEAKRKIVAALGPPHFIAGGSAAPYDAVLRLLAAPYSGHPQFDLAWRVQ